MTHTITLKLGNSFEEIEKLKGVGAVVCDPPYLISFMGKSWDDTEGENVDWFKGWLQKCYDILPSGGVVKVFSATRTFHRLAQALEQVGFKDIGLEAWAYGCLSEDTEILTSEGWVPYHKAKVGVSVLGFDLETRGLHWQPVLETFEYPYDKKAYSIQSVADPEYVTQLYGRDPNPAGKYTDQIVSEGHRLVVLKREDRGFPEPPKHTWEFVRVEDVPKNEPVIIPGLKTWEDGSSGDIGPQSCPHGMFSVRATIQEIHYTGIVWCVKVETGAFVARRNGKVFITGNSGFPKSLNVSKAIDRHLGKEDEREVLGDNPSSRPNSKIRSGRGFDGPLDREREEEAESAGVQQVTAAATEEAKRFEGWGTALKPAWEPFILGTKP